MQIASSTCAGSYLIYKFRYPRHRKRESDCFVCVGFLHSNQPFVLYNASLSNFFILRQREKCANYAEKSIIKIF